MLQNPDAHVDRVCKILQKKKKKIPRLLQVSLFSAGRVTAAPLAAARNMGLDSVQDCRTAQRTSGSVPSSTECWCALCQMFFTTFWLPQKQNHYNYIHHSGRHNKKMKRGGCQRLISAPCVLGRPHSAGDVAGLHRSHFENPARHLYEKSKTFSPSSSCSGANQLPHPWF